MNACVYKLSHRLFLSPSLLGFTPFFWENVINSWLFSSTSRTSPCASLRFFYPRSNLVVDSVFFPTPPHPTIILSGESLSDRKFCTCFPSNPLSEAHLVILRLTWPLFSLPDSFHPPFAGFVGKKEVLWNSQLPPPPLHFSPFGISPPPSTGIYILTTLFFSPDHFFPLPTGVQCFIWRSLFCISRSFLFRFLYLKKATFDLCPLAFPPGFSSLWVPSAFFLKAEVC